MLRHLPIWIRTRVVRFYYSDKKSGFFGVIGNTAKIYQWVYPVILIFHKAAASLTSYFFWSFGAALFVQAMHSATKEKAGAGGEIWAKRNAAQTEAVAVAINMLAGHINHNTLGEVPATRYMSVILQAIRFEVEKLVLDAESVYINATLMQLSRADDRYLEIVARAFERSARGRYRKTEMFVYQAMDTKVPKYLPEIFEDGRPYRCILGIPIVIVDSNTGISRAIGVISIDSGRPYHFDGIEAKIYSEILPLVNLLKLAVKR